MSAASLQAAIDSIDALIAGEMARRAAIVAAGDPAPTTFSAGGKSVDFNGWLKDMLDGRQALVEQKQREDGSWEFVTRGWG